LNYHRAGVVAQRPSTCMRPGVQCQHQKKKRKKKKLEKKKYHYRTVIKKFNYALSYSMNKYFLSLSNQKGIGLTK
jgi:hypothetical protein